MTPRAPDIGFPRILAISVLAGTALVPAVTAQTVAVLQPETRDLVRQTTQPAFAEPFFTADLGVKVTGYVEEVKVDIGSRVKAGDVLLTVSVPEMAEQREVLLAEQAELETAVAAARAEFNAVRSESNRIIELVKTGSVTRKAADEARAKQEAAEAQVEGAQARLGSAGSRIAEIDALIGFATMRAPFDGVVSHRSVDPGDLVRAAGDSKEAPAPLLRVAQTGKLRVVTHVPERDAVWVDAGDEVLVRFDALPGKVVAGTVTRTSGVLDSSTQRLRVEADIDNNDGVLLPGMFGQATISLEARPQALVIPPGSVRFGGEVPIVYVVEGGRISHREVELGLDDGQWIEVLSGLRAGDKVVKEMLGRLEEGAAVTVKQFP